MYITYDQLCQMLEGLESAYKSLPWYAVIKKYRTGVMMGTVYGMLKWITEAVKAEKEEKCEHCGTFHSDMPDFRGN